MLVAKIAVSIFKYDELQDEAKVKAIDSSRVWLLDNINNDFDSKEEHDLYVEDIVYDDNFIIQEIKENKFWFFNDGTFAETYSNVMQRSEFLHLKLFGEDYFINAK